MPDGATPEIPAWGDDPNAVELGVRFRSDSHVLVGGIRFYKGEGNTGPHTGRLWTDTGTLLGTVIFTDETDTGWQTAAFDTPIPIDANTTYLASYHAPAGHYAVTHDAFATSGIDNAPLHFLPDVMGEPNGVYRYGSGGEFPTDTFPGSLYYWVDVVLLDDVDGDGFAASSTTSTTELPTTTTSTTEPPTTTTSFTTTTTLPDTDDPRRNTCAPTPVAGCQAGGAGKVSLRLRNVRRDAHDRLEWKWAGDAGVTTGDLGANPTASDYLMCVYANDSLVLSALAPQDAGCTGKPCWKGTTRRFRYRNAGLTPDGLSTIVLSTGKAGRIMVKGKGSNLSLPTLPLMAPVAVQLWRTDGGPCWESRIATPLVNSSTRFRGRSR